MQVHKAHPYSREVWEGQRRHIAKGHVYRKGGEFWAIFYPAQQKMYFKIVEVEQTARLPNSYPIVLSM